MDTFMYGETAYRVQDCNLNDRMRDSAQPKLPPLIICGHKYASCTQSRVVELLNVDDVIVAVVLLNRESIQSVDRITLQNCKRPQNSSFSAHINLQTLSELPFLPGSEHLQLAAMICNKLASRSVYVCQRSTWVQNGSTRRRPAIIIFLKYTKKKKPTNKQQTGKQSRADFLGLQCVYAELAAAIAALNVLPPFHLTAGAGM